MLTAWHAACVEGSWVIVQLAPKHGGPNEQGCHFEADMLHASCTGVVGLGQELTAALFCSQSAAQTPQAAQLCCQAHAARWCPEQPASKTHRATPHSPAGDLQHAGAAIYGLAVLDGQGTNSHECSGWLCFDCCGPTPLLLVMFCVVVLTDSHLDATLVSFAGLLPCWSLCWLSRPSPPVSCWRQCGAQRFTLLV